MTHLTQTIHKENNTKRLGFLIKVARTDAKLTQSALAKKIKTKQESITRAEKHGCSLVFAEKAVNAMGFEISNIALRAKDPRKQGLTFYC